VLTPPYLWSGLAAWARRRRGRLGRVEGRSAGNRAESALSAGPRLMPEPLAQTP